ncbi:MAG TPA: FecR family protein [Candidatus Binataceae bacterium]|nr:FecR family protein [Candidatus Binataceae bacterium]
MSHPAARFVIVSLVFMLALIVAPRAHAQTPAGTISALSGNVVIERAGKPIPAAQGTALEVGDKLKTAANSRVTIGLSDGSTLELSDSSTLVLTENVLNPDGSRARTKVTLLGGLVRSLVKHNPAGNPNFEVHTPNAVASARGTMFDVSYQEGQPPPALP